jgi:hypothetical protein
MKGKLPLWYERVEASAQTTTEIIAKKLSFMQVVGEWRLAVALLWNAILSPTHDQRLITHQSRRHSVDDLDLLAAPRITRIYSSPFDTCSRVV